MTAYDYFTDLDNEDYRIERCREKIKRLENLAHSLSSKPFDTDKIQTSGSKDRIGDLTVRIVQEKENLNRLVLANEERREYIEENIERMGDPINKRIITYLYIDKRRYSDIARSLDLSEKTIRNRHSAAMKEFEDVFRDN